MTRRRRLVKRIMGVEMMMRARHVRLILFALFTAGCSRPSASAESDAVLAVVQRFFETMAARDVDGARAILLPEGRFYSIRDSAGAAIVRTFTNAQYVTDLPSMQGRLERMWDADVRIDGRMATVWTPYDYHRDGQFSHCGVDAFDLLKTDDGWKIAGGVYSVQRTKCAPSPLGPPKPKAPS